MNLGRNFLFWLVVISIVAFLYSAFDQNNLGGAGYTKLAFSDFLNKIDEGNIKDVTIQGNNIDGHFNDGNRFNTYTPFYPELIERLKQGGVRIDAVPLDSKMNSLLGILISWFPLLLLLGVWIYFMKGMQGGGRGAMGVGKSRA
ncbi:MAG: ATP-dependent metallopeptidase FtsH/Yme1/Tma family protein, partial [Pseudomonadota bacterium]